jgi:hypothetical protein
VPILSCATSSQGLASHAHCAGASLHKARLIHYPDPFFLSTRLDDERLEPVTGRVRIPGHAGPEPLHAVGNPVPDRLGHLPALVPLDLRQQSAQRRFRLLARLAAGKQVREASMKRRNILTPGFQFFQGHGLPPSRSTSSSKHGRLRGNDGWRTRACPKRRGESFHTDAFVWLYRLCERETATLLASYRQTMCRMRLQKPLEALPWEGASLAFSDMLYYFVIVQLMGTDA